MVQTHQPVPAWRTNAVGVITALLSVASAAAVVVVAQADRARGAMLGMALAGVVALLSGLSVIGFSWNRRRNGASSERPRMLLGTAVIVWGSGQFLLSLQMTPTGQRVFGIGDIVSSMCMPVLVLAVISMPRRSRVSRPALRMALDSLIVTMSITLTLWWTLLQPALSDAAHPGGSAVFGVLMTLFDTGAAAITTMMWTRDLRHGAAAVATGLMLQAVADITSLPAVVGDRPLPWALGAIWCTAAGHP